MKSRRPSPREPVPVRPPARARFSLFEDEDEGRARMTRFRRSQREFPVRQVLSMNRNTCKTEMISTADHTDFTDCHFHQCNPRNPWSTSGSGVHSANFRFVRFSSLIEGVRDLAPKSSSASAFRHNARVQRDEGRFTIRQLASDGLRNDSVGKPPMNTNRHEANGLPP